MIRITNDGVAGEAEVLSSNILEIPITSEVLASDGGEATHLLLPVVVKVDGSHSRLTSTFSMGLLEASDDAPVGFPYNSPNGLITGGSTPFESGMYGYTDIWALRSWQSQDTSSSFGLFIYRVLNDMPIGTILTLELTNPHTFLYMASRAHIIRGLACHPVGNRHSTIVGASTPTSLKIPFHDGLDDPEREWSWGDLLVVGQQHQHEGWIDAWIEPDITVPVSLEDGTWTAAGVTWTYQLAPNYTTTELGRFPAIKITGDHTAAYVKGRRLKFSPPSGPVLTRYAIVRGSELIGGDTYVYYDPPYGISPLGANMPSPFVSDDPAPPGWPRYLMQWYEFNNTIRTKPVWETRHWGYGIYIFDEDDYIRDYFYPMFGYWQTEPIEWYQDTVYIEGGPMGHFAATYPSGTGVGCSIPTTMVEKDRILAYYKETEWHAVPDSSKPHELVRYKSGWEQVWQNDIVTRKDSDWHQPLE